MTIDAAQFQKLLNEFQLSSLFVNELGWDNPSLRPQSVPVNGYTFTLTHVANKRGVAVFMCSPDALGSVPPRATLLKIEKEATKLSYEHLLIFADASQKVMTWLWVARVPGQPAATRTHTWHKGTSGEALRQKLNQIVWSLEDEEAITLTDVIKGLRSAFDRDRVSKRFYDHFKTEHQAFSDFIEGIDAETDQAWYASLMLNRLMFIYFIQQKGFLDGNPNYLSDRMETVRQQAGKGKFHTFYRQFLRRLFHEGLGQHKKSRVTDLSKLIGDVPYLNGGIFDVHELEVSHPDINIPDEAFQRLFTFFDAYDWHLDDRPLSSGSGINPDVLGYIFEKYINQKQMGAYYTKEDITEYISKSCIIPFLFDAVRTKCKVAFENSDGPTVWDFLKENPDRYIFEAVKKGVHLALPKDVDQGVNSTQPDLLGLRSGWNKAASAEFALPTETWREVVARRARYQAIYKKLAVGDVRDINDFITHNIDLRQFAQDVIQSCEGPDLLMAFWQATTNITILDPTGGSGAFIFAALNILEPLYEGCLDRMEGFLAEWGEAGKKHHPNYYKNFNDVLSRVDSHHSRRYFVLKSIILNNLYAVDIMEEAVEICKLRLFLKLASQVEPDNTKDNMGIEPLPDIDFNIRAGNTLVGYATYDELKKAVTSGLDFDNAMEKIAVKAVDLQQSFDKFRQLQTEGDGSVPQADKVELKKHFKALEDELNCHLASEYGVSVTNKVAYANWVKSHQPFHWFIQFYGILNSGGFDVIIGNPPYVEYTKSKRQYAVGTYKTLDCGNLYAFCVERSVTLLSERGAWSMIIPLSAFATARMQTLQTLIRKTGASIHVSFFSGDSHPSRLFEGVNLRLAIVSSRKGKSAESYFSTKHNRWYAEARPVLFESIHHQAATAAVLDTSMPKIGHDIENSIMKKIRGQPLLRTFEGRGQHQLFYHNCPVHWIRATDFVPRFNSERGGDGISTQIRPLAFANSQLRDAAICIINSSLFFWYWLVYSDCYHLTDRELGGFPINFETLTANSGEVLSGISLRLMKDYKLKSRERVYTYKTTGKVVYDEFYPKYSKLIIDEIDTVLAKHYGFTADELDFIINYDIKYRLGRGAGEEDE